MGVIPRRKPLKNATSTSSHHCCMHVCRCSHLSTGRCMDSHMPSHALAISHPPTRMDKFLKLYPGPSIHQTTDVLSCHVLCTIFLVAMAAIFSLGRHYFLSYLMCSVSPLMDACVIRLRTLELLGTPFCDSGPCLSCSPALILSRS